MKIEEVKKSVIKLQKLALAMSKREEQVITMEFHASTAGVAELPVPVPVTMMGWTALVQPNICFSSARTLEFMMACMMAVVVHSTKAE